MLKRKRIYMKKNKTNKKENKDKKAKTEKKENKDSNDDKNPNEVATTISIPAESSNVITFKQWLVRLLCWPYEKVLICPSVTQLDLVSKPIQSCFVSNDNLSTDSYLSRWSGLLLCSGSTADIVKQSYDILQRGGGTAANTYANPKHPLDRLDIILRICTQHALAMAFKLLDDRIFGVATAFSECLINDPNLSDIWVTNEITTSQENELCGPFLKDNSIESYQSNTNIGRMFWMLNEFSSTMRTMHGGVDVYISHLVAAFFQGARNCKEPLLDFNILMIVITGGMYRTCHVIASHMKWSDQLILCEMFSTISTSLSEFYNKVYNRFQNMRRERIKDFRDSIWSSSENLQLAKIYNHHTISCATILFNATRRLRLKFAHELQSLLEPWISPQVENIIIDYVNHLNFEFKHMIPFYMSTHNKN